ncbi:protein kinase [Bisporella sp. PMI_857]|nr:protein kinase [Bisporella sp. PMI_857]
MMNSYRYLLKSIRYYLKRSNNFCITTKARIRMMAFLAPSPPISFPKSSFVVLNTEDKIEEEALPFYNPVKYYPVHVGEVFRSRYQVITKLGYGVNSTVWLCQDLNDHRYLTLKVRVRTKRHDSLEQHDDQESAISRYLENCSLDHFGRTMIRPVLDSFDIIGPSGAHKCLLYQPLWWSFAAFQDLLPEKRFPRDLVQQCAQLLLIALDFLHRCDVADFTIDLSPNNVLMRIKDESILPEFAQEEVEQPFARMVRSDRTIYISRPMPVSPGQPVLCDFGEARVGRHKHTGNIMPRIMRAPEVILGIEWNCKVDIWALGIMTWHLLEGDHLFSVEKEGILEDEQHLAEMVSLLGPPPKSLLGRSEKCGKYWDTEGNWRGSIPIPEQSFESREQLLDNASKTALINFLCRALRWVPEERPVAEELAFDKFLMGYQ